MLYNDTAQSTSFVATTELNRVNLTSRQPRHMPLRTHVMTAILITSTADTATAVTSALFALASVLCYRVATRGKDGASGK